MTDMGPLGKVLGKMAAGNDATIQCFGDGTRLGCGCFDAHDYVNDIHEHGRCERHAAAEAQHVGDRLESAASAAVNGPGAARRR